MRFKITYRTEGVDFPFTSIVELEPTSLLNAPSEAINEVVKDFPEVTEIISCIRIG